MNKYSISIVLPAYNEEKNIEKTVFSIIAFMPTITPDYEIIIINDGSQDKTADIIENLKKKYQVVKTIHHQTNEGYGSAISDGIQHGTKNLIAYMDSDGQFKIEDIAKFVEQIESYDVISGIRKKRNDNIYRYFLGKLYMYVSRILFGMKVRDVNCGFKLFRSSFVNQLELNTTGALINSEILACGYKLGKKIGNVEVSHYKRVHGNQTGGSVKVVAKAFIGLFHLWFKLRK